MQFQCFFSSKAFPSYVRSLLPLFLNGTCRTPGERLTKALWTCLSQHLGFIFVVQVFFFQKIPVVPKNKKLYGTCWQAFQSLRVFLQKKKVRYDWIDTFASFFVMKKWKCFITRPPPWSVVMAKSQSSDSRLAIPSNRLPEFFLGDAGGEIIILPQFAPISARRLNNHQSAQWIQCIVVPGRLAKVSSLNHATSPSHAGHI